MLKYIHGSQDSTDVDVMYIFDSIPEKADASRFCSDNSVENKNIAVVKDGVVVWVYKGTVDEVNNALMTTIPLHPENPPSIITRMLERDILAKGIRIMRGSLTQCSRTEYRSIIKKATTGYSWRERCAVLEEIAYESINDFGKQDRTETYKFFAFQWGQFAGLLEGKELYTKGDVAWEFPMLHPYLYRQPNLGFNEGLAFYRWLFLEWAKGLDVVEEGSSVLFPEYGRRYDLKMEVQLPC